MRLSIEVELDYHFPAAADVLLSIEAAQLPDQLLLEDLLTVDGAAGPMRPIAGETGSGGRPAFGRGAVPAAYLATGTSSAPAQLSTPLPPSRARPSGSGLPIFGEPILRGDRFDTFFERRLRGLEAAPGSPQGRVDRPIWPMCRRAAHGPPPMVVGRRACAALCPSDGELRRASGIHGAALLCLCVAARSPRFPRSGRSLAGLAGGRDATCLGRSGLVRIAVGRDAPTSPS